MTINYTTNCLKKKKRTINKNRSLHFNDKQMNKKLSQKFTLTNINNMFKEFQGKGEKYLINVSLITFVIDNGSNRMIMTAFDEIEVINSIEEIKGIINDYYRSKTVSMYN